MENHFPLNIVFFSRSKHRRMLSRDMLLLCCNLQVSVKATLNASKVQTTTDAPTGLLKKVGVSTFPQKVGGYSLF